MFNVKYTNNRQFICLMMLKGKLYARADRLRSSADFDRNCRSILNAVFGNYKYGKERQ